MIKEGILAAYLLWMAAVDAKTKTVPVWPGIAGILLFSVMGVVKGQGILSLLGGIVIGVFCFTVSVLSRQAVGAGDGIVLGVTGAALGWLACEDKIVLHQEDGELYIFLGVNVYIG